MNERTTVDSQRAQGITRRRLLGAAAGAATLTALPTSMRKALAAPAPQLRSIKQIEHVILLMQENRSFDHYFGALRGVRGFDDPTAMRLPSGESVFRQPDPDHPDGYLLPFRQNTKTTNSARAYGTGHAWPVQHRSWNNGAMDNWVVEHTASDGAHGPYTMGYLTREDLPFHYALADAFTVCDNYHCSVIGPTHPNRVMAMSGTLDPHGLGNGPVLDSSAPKAFYTWTTYPERLQRAGVSWKYFTANPYDTGHGWFKNFAEAKPGDPLYDNGMVPYSPSMVADVIRRDELPSVTWLDAQYLPKVYGLPEGAEGPGNLVAGGAEYMATILDALASTPQVWEKTMFVITYDENDGRFDHVAPPVPPPGTPDEYVTVSPLPASAGGIAGPIGLGFRVPTIVVSPFSQGGWVCSEIFDHTSTLKFLERRFGVREPNISAWRRSTVGDLTSALRLDGQGKRPYPKGIPTYEDTVAQYELENQEAATLPPPVIPTVQQTPHQEPGSRPHTR